MTLKNAWMWTLVVPSAVFLLCSGRPAAAQIPFVGLPSAISAGGFFPSSDRARDNGGDVQSNVEARYTLPVSVPLVASRTLLSIGVESAAKDDTHSTIVPVTVGEYFGANGKSPLASRNFYFGAGAGAYILNENGISTTARIGGYGALGYNLTEAVFLEAKYQLVQDGDGLSLQAGLRF